MKAKKGIIFIKPLYRNNDYEIDDTGTVYSKRTGRAMSPRENDQGYLVVDIRTNEKKERIRIHKAVAQSFYPEKFETDSKLEVIHKDGNRLNNNLENLDIVTREERIKHNLDLFGCPNSGSNNPNAVPIKAYDTNGNLVYERGSIAELALELADGDKSRANSIRNSIIRAKSGKRSTYMGLIWKSE